MLTFDWGITGTRNLAAAVLAGSALLLHSGRLSAQLIVRGLWTSAAVLGAVNLIFGWSFERVTSAAIVLGAAASLGAMGRRGLEPGASVTIFAPVAFRGTLLVTMALALADAQSLLFYGFAWLERFGLVTSSLALGGLMCASLFGLYRLRVWGLLLSAISNVAVVAAAVSGVLAVPSPVDAVLAGTALLQLVLLLPVLRAVVRGARAGETAGVDVNVDASVDANVATTAAQLAMARVRVAPSTEPMGVEASAADEAAAEVDVLAIDPPRRRR
jgi:hypothetical protein